MAKSQVNEICSEMADLPETNKPAAAHHVDFDVPLYNVWKQHGEDGAVLPLPARVVPSSEEQNGLG
jgi:hypothetical protein